MKLDQWATSLIKNFYNQWESKYKWKKGFKIFYGPVRKNPNLMILSYNPGGGIDNFTREDHHRYEAGDFSPPKINSYIVRKNHMAKRMQDFFSGNEKMLKESVILPVLFFRSKNKKEWRESFPKEKRIKAEKLCFSLLDEIITKINPEKFLIMGIDTFETLENNFFGKLPIDEVFHSQYGEKRERLYIKSHWNGKPIFVIRHPTGSRISIKDWEKAKKHFFKIS